MPTDLRPPVPDPARPGHSLGAAVERLRERRAWIIGLGALGAALGVVALVLVETATVASVLVIGVFMMVTGLVEIVVGLRARSWGRMLLWAATGLLYLVAGLFAVALPELASLVLTLMLGAGLMATGLLRVVMGVRMQGSPARGGLLLAGGVTTLLGLLILVGWPGNSVLVLGTFLGLDLLFYGITWIVLGVRLGRHHPVR